MDAVVDGKLPEDLDSASIVSRVIGQKISDGSIGDLYTRCRVKCASDPIKNQTPQFMDLGFLTINALDKISGLSNPATRIQRPTDGYHWSASTHVFGEAKSVGLSEAKSDYDYNYKMEFQIWKENREFERQFS